VLALVFDVPTKPEHVSRWFAPSECEVPKLTMKLAFRDRAGRDQMTKFDGQEDSVDKMEIS